MSKFWQVRLATLTWGFLASWAVTGKLVVASRLMLVIFIGNTIIMRWILKE